MGHGSLALPQLTCGWERSENPCHRGEMYGFPFWKSQAYFVLLWCMWLLREIGIQSVLSFLTKALLVAWQTFPRCRHATSCFWEPRGRLSPASPALPSCLILAISTTVTLCSRCLRYVHPCSLSLLDVLRFVVAASSCYFHSLLAGSAEEGGSVGGSKVHPGSACGQLSWEFWRKGEGAGRGWSLLRRGVQGCKPDPQRGFDF